MPKNSSSQPPSASDMPPSKDPTDLPFHPANNLKMPTNMPAVSADTKIPELPREKEVQKETLNTHSHSVESPVPRSTSSLDNQLELANKILDIIKSYGTTEKTDKSPQGCAKTTFLPVVLDYIKNKSPIRMILPAFPAKSPNRKGKVLGALPDLGEEIALQCLQGLCDNIRQIYKPGAEVSIASDGLVYNGKY